MFADMQTFYKRVSVSIVSYYSMHLFPDNYIVFLFTLFYYLNVIRSLWSMVDLL